MRLVLWRPFGRVPEISAAELARRLAAADDDVLVLDVRTRLEYARGHIPGARHLPFQRIVEAIPALEAERGRQIVAVCRTAHRSIPVVRFLRRAGFRAAQPEGGMNAWRRAGLPAVRGQEQEQETEHR